MKRVKKAVAAALAVCGASVYLMYRFRGTDGYGWVRWFVLAAGCLALVLLLARKK